MKRYFLLLLLAILMTHSQSKAQVTLGISPYSVIISNDTLPGGATDSIFFWVVNSGAAAFSDNITFHTEVQDSSGVFYLPIDTSNTGIVTIPANDSLKFTLYPTYTIGPALYHYDINVIVIWPVALTASTGDSLTYIEVLTIPIGVDELDLTRLIKAYPNPTSNNFTLENTGKNAIEEVRIYDLTGRLIQTEKNPLFICTDQWKAGTYLIKIQLENKQTRTIRVIKQ
ncbi:MAG: T9SS type A sorting domain-containing protein [Bacteroidetes bacterium]|nr:T9SS type A sorting domain-containing protein [Bacteroidota bacterium]